MLRKNQISDFACDGFLIVNALYDEEQMREIIIWTSDVSNYPEVPGKYMMYFEKSQLHIEKRILSRLEDLEPYHEGFSKLLNGEKLKGNIYQLFGEE